VSQLVGLLRRVDATPDANFPPVTFFILPVSFFACVALLAHSMGVKRLLTKKLILFPVQGPPSFEYDPIDRLSKRVALPIFSLPRRLNRAFTV